MNDKIFINDIEVFAKHGVRPEERQKLQKFVISVAAKFDATYAKIFDEVSYTVDYAKLLSIVINATEKSSFCLIECLAAHLAEKIFHNFKLITFLDLEIKKFPDDLANKKFSSIGFCSSFFRNEK